MIENGQLLNYIGGKWKRSRASEFLVDGRNTSIPNYEHATGKEGIWTDQSKMYKLTAISRN